MQRTVVNLSTLALAPCWQRSVRGARGRGKSTEAAPLWGSALLPTTALPGLASSPPA